MVVKQYPHYLFVTVSAGATQDDNGNWVGGTSGNVFKAMCREETDGRGSEVEIAGGRFVRFTSMVQLPLDTGVIAEGTTVLIANNADGSGVRVKGEVLKFDKGQLHSRLWV